MIIADIHCVIIFILLAWWHYCGMWTPLDALGATIVGVLSGIPVVAVVELLDLKLHIDDPVGAVGVHYAKDLWGTIAVGSLDSSDAPARPLGLLS